MPKSSVKCNIKFPLHFLADYMQKSFGVRFSDTMTQYRRGLIPLYKDFKRIVNRGNMIVARGSFLEDLVSEIQTEPYPDSIPTAGAPKIENSSFYLDSVKSLQPYRKELEVKSTTRQHFNYPLDEFQNLLRGFHTKRERKLFRELCMSEDDVFEEIIENANAFSYWCMKNISDGNRIGTVARINGLPVLDGLFIEMPMDDYFPEYDHLAKPMLSTDDFLYFMSEDETTERILDVYDEFGKAVKEGNIERAARISRILNRYSMKLGAYSPEQE